MDSLMNRLYKRRDWFDRHQGVVLAVILFLILLGGYIEQNP